MSRGMSRRTFLGELADITPVKDSLMDCFESEEREKWREEENSPHGYEWHTSFHASAQPGDDDSVCGRAQVYELMNPAPEKPLEPWLRAMFETGSNIEHMHVKRFAKKGLLLSKDVTGGDQYQDVFEDPTVWLSGSPDAIILPRFHTKSHVVEAKSTSHEKIENMIADPGYLIHSHQKYLRQLKTYIAEAHLKPFSPTVPICRISGSIIKGDRCNWAHTNECDPVLIKVAPPDDGTLFYCSREEPLKTISFYVTLDLEFLEAGKKKLAKWKQEFIEDKIPPHVHENSSSKWSVGECKFCKHKKPYCKIDYKNKTEKLSESELVNHTKKIRPAYDKEATRSKVFARWGNNNSS